jgi:hypothetical protein
LAGVYLPQPSRLLGWLLGLSVLFGCRSDAERRRQADIARLAEHVDRLRSADNRDKRVALSRLNEVGCTEPETCALKELCVQAYTLHVAALDTITRLKRQAASDAGRLAPSPGAAIAETERQLLEARTLSQRCAEEQIRLVRKALL